MIDPFLRLLRELGLTPKELAEFKQRQTVYRKQEKQILEFNNKALGSRTGTKSYTWKQLYEQSTNKASEIITKNSKQTSSQTPKQSEQGFDLGEWTREEIKQIYEEQSKQYDNYNEYGLSSELINLITETKKHYEIYSKQQRGLDETLQHVSNLLSNGGDVEIFVSVLNEFNDIFGIYFDEYTEQFPKTVENKFFAEIAAAGNLLGFN